MKHKTNVILILANYWLIFLSRHLEIHIEFLVCRQAAAKINVTEQQLRKQWNGCVHVYCAARTVTQINANS